MHSPRTYQVASPPVTAKSTLPSSWGPLPPGDPQQLSSSTHTQQSRSCSSSYPRPRCLHDCQTLHPRGCPGQDHTRSSGKEGFLHIQVCKSGSSIFTIVPQRETLCRPEATLPEASHADSSRAQAQDPSPKSLSGSVSSLSQQVTTSPIPTTYTHPGDPCSCTVCPFFFLP